MPITVCLRCGRDLSPGGISRACPACGTLRPGPDDSADSVRTISTAPTDPQATWLTDPGLVCPAPPAHVPGYEVLEELGRGGMGVVYKARQIKLNRVVALKMILSGAHAGEADLARFRTEAEAIARLQHPNIVAVYEVGEHEGKPFFSLEFCPGGSLEKKLDGTPLPTEKAAELVECLARAVHAAHQASIVHRDIKPANVLLSARGTPKITDFGLAKKLDDVGQTQSGTIMGTPSYMAPEQAQGKKDLGPPADIWALGALLYECLTGRPPFKGATPLETVMQVVSKEPVPPSQLQPRTSRDLETICLKCLQKLPVSRYHSAEELAEDLARLQRGEPIRARPVGPLSHLVRWCRRNPLVAGLTALVVLLLLASLGNLRASLNSVRGLARRNQGLLAESLAGRLDERVHSDAQAVLFLSRLAEVRALLAAPPDRRAALVPATREALSNIVRSNKDFSSAFVLDGTGLALASTNPAHPGHSYAFRDYFRQARQGRPYRSKMLVGTSTHQAGMYYSAPVRGRGDKVLGVVVIKLEATTLWRIIDSLDAGEAGSVFLVDEDGIIVAHQQRALLYHSVASPTDESLRQIAPRDRFQMDSIPSANTPDLAVLVAVAESGQLDYTRPEDGARRVVAYAPLREMPWVVAVDMAADQFAGPAYLRRWRNAVATALVAVLAALVALPLIRRGVGLVRGATRSDLP